jgi:CheY-like chemotaxis protein
MGIKKNILLVENDIPSKIVIMHFLQNEYEVDHAIDGITALKLIEKKQYSVILMDIDLGPGMDGLEAVNAIKKIPGYSDIPIVAVTAYAMIGDKEKFLAKGCTHYISKPFIKPELLSLLKDII